MISMCLAYEKHYFDYGDSTAIANLMGIWAMAKFQPIEYSFAGEALLSIYDEILATLKLTVVPEWVVYLGGCPHLLSGFWQMVKGTPTNGELNQLLQELILFCVSRTNGAPYCTEIHVASAIKLNSALTYHDLLDISCGNTNAVLPR
jgi:AhpD family alkylhydroperoxidase